ncbi:MAG: hypothetical protein FWG22_01545 [Prolixibacteraceae bacterium]|nr:hypothetical protein [Prolixibacteraceae bacterium]
MGTKVKKDSSSLVIAVILIIVGSFWILKEVGVNINFFVLFEPFTRMFNKLGRIIFSWPMVLLIVGLILVANRKTVGWILAGLGGFFLLPLIFPKITFLTSGLFFPLAIIAVGVYIIVRRL